MIISTLCCENNIAFPFSQVHALLHYNKSKFLSLTLTPTKPSSMAPCPSYVAISPCSIFEMMVSVNCV